MAVLPVDAAGPLVVTTSVGHAAAELEPSEKIRAVVLDLTGVLTTDMQKEVPALAQALGVEADEPTVRRIWEELYLPASLGRITADEFWHEFCLRLEGRCTNALLVERQWLGRIRLSEPDLGETLSRLKARFRLGLLSNHIGRWARTLLESHDLNQYFDGILISSDAGTRKPERSLYKSICATVGVPPSNSVYVADEEEDLVAAQSVGMTPIFIPGEDASSRIGNRIEAVSDLLTIL